MPTAKPQQVESIILTHFAQIIANGNENCILIIHFSYAFKPAKRGQFTAKKNRLRVGDKEWGFCATKNSLQKGHFTQHGIASTAEVQLMRAPPRQLLPHVQLSLLKTWGN